MNWSDSLILFGLFLGGGAGRVVSNGFYELVYVIRVFFEGCTHVAT